MSESNGSVENYQTAPRDIVISIDHFSYANIEAWKNIIESYLKIHPNHDVSILYEGKTFNNMLSLFKMGSKPNRQGFQMVVTAPEKELQDVPKLYRFLVEGASQKFNQYIEKEIFQVLKIF